VFCLAALCCASLAQADGFDADASTFLDLGSFHTTLQYPDDEHEAHVGQFGVAYSEPLGLGLNGGLRGGYATLQVDGEPQPLALNFDGRYLGLDLRYEGTEGDYLNFSGEFAYTWHDVNGDSFSEPPSEITWYESWLAVGPVVRWQRLRLSFGAYYQYLQGSETDARPAQELGFHSDRGAGGYLGLSVYLDQANALGLYVTAGARQGVRLVFRRDF
jgi:opacity protein-like surface antigen